MVLLAYVAIRASSLESITHILMWDVSSIEGKRHKLELAGIGVVATGAVASIYRQRKVIGIADRP